jgi:hypothetical protein
MKVEVISGEFNVAGNSALTNESYARNLVTE